MAARGPPLSARSFHFVHDKSLGVVHLRHCTNGRVRKGVGF